jgi:hypothetical protein
MQQKCIYRTHHTHTRPYFLLSAPVKKEGEEEEECGHEFLD